MITYLKRKWRRYKLNRRISRWKPNYYVNPAKNERWMVWTTNRGPTPSREEIEKLSVDFKMAMNTSKKVFGVYAFRKLFALNTMRNPVNKSLFEIWSVCLEKFDSKLLIEKKESIVNGYIKALNGDGEYLKSITESTGNIGRVNKRFKKTMEIINEAIL